MIIVSGKCEEFCKRKNLNGVVRLFLIGVAVMSLLKQLVLKHWVYAHATENSNSILAKARDWI